MGKRTSIYLDPSDYQYLLLVAAKLTTMRRKQYNISNVISLLVRFLKLIHNHSIESIWDLQDEELKALILAKP